MSHITKILLNIIQEGIQNKIKTEVTGEQFSFLKNSDTRETILCYRMLTENIYIEVEKKKFMYSL